MSLVVDPSIEDLPVRVMVDILSRLPVKKIVHCKCVCKKWLNIVLDPYFADIQLSGSSPTGFMAKEWIDFKKARFLKWVEVEDELDHHNLLHDPVMRLDLNLAATSKKSPIRQVGSVNGLLCLRQGSRSIDNTYICNPITREYTILPKQQYSNKVSKNITYCFGVGSVTQEYKVIRIQKFKKSEVGVYTLGTGQWRSLGDVPYQIHQLDGPFLNGHAHWTLDCMDPTNPLYAFDFDKETFELFPSPPDIAKGSMANRLGVLNGCLCRCDSYKSNLTVWVMKEYGFKNSWHKDLVIKYSTIPDRDMADLDWLGLKPWYPIQGYKDGTILMGTTGGKLIIYCPRRNTIAETGIRDHGVTTFVYRPSFHRLHNFKNERVHSF